MLLARVAEPLILIDWSDLKADQSVHLLRASLAVGGRSLTLYEEVHGQQLLGNRGVQTRFLRTLATLLPAHVAPIIIADSGFKVPFYREVEHLGWRWVGRVRGRDYLRPNQRWVSCKTLFKRATATPTSLGVGEWVRSNPICAVLVLVRLAPKGRRGHNAFGKRSRSKASQQSARAAKEPWLLVASPKLAERPAKHVVKLYRQRMQIEIYQSWCLHRAFIPSWERCRRWRRGRAAPSGGVRCAGRAGAPVRWRRPTPATGGGRHVRPGGPAASLCATNRRR